MASTSRSALAPIHDSERLDVVDALRGLALAGVLFVNVGIFSQYFYLGNDARAALPTAAFDAVVEVFNALFVDRKAMTLFSLLFGFGFAIQLERAAKRGAGGLSLYVRRTCVLLLLGVVHALLICWVDVLLMYALLALVLIAFRNLSSRALLATGFFVALVLPSLVAPWMEAAVSGLPKFAQMQSATLALLSSPSYASVLEANLRFGLWSYAAWWDDWLFIFGRFLLGYWAGRSGLFHRAHENRDLVKRIFIVAMVAGLAATALKFRQADLVSAIPALGSGVGSAAMQGVFRAGPLGMGIGYACGFALLFLSARWRPGLQLLAPVGRMALTNYLMQSVVCIAIFYRIGLDVGPGHGYVSRLIAWGLLFGFQIAFSHWWLARYRFGPAEWLWRSLTYRRWQPMRPAVAANPT